MQTKKQSFYEACVNTLIGFIISLISTPIVFNICGVQYTGYQMGMVTLLMTGVSILRSYVIRRFFNKKELDFSELKNDKTQSPFFEGGRGM